MSWTAKRNKDYGLYAYDYYDVEIPEDAESDPERRGQLAFMAAEELTRLYATPCYWTVISDDGNKIRVRRKRYKSKRKNVYVASEETTW